MSRSAFLINLFLFVSAALKAQTVSVGAHGMIADYGDANTFYRGTGGGLTVLLRHGRLSVQGTMSRTAYHRTASIQGIVYHFTSTQLDGLLGYEVTNGLTAEIGVMRRDSDLEFAVQDMRAGRIGLTYSRPIGPGVTVGLRSDYLVHSQFSGGGSAGLAVDLELLLSVGPRNGRYRLTMASSFQRVDRTVNGFQTPIKQAVLSMGAAVGF